MLQARKERGGGVAPRPNNRITVSATKKSMEPKRKGKNTIRERNGKRQDERTKRTKKDQGRGTRRTTKKRGKKKKEKEKREKGKKEKENGKGVRVALLC